MKARYAISSITLLVFVALLSQKALSAGSGGASRIPPIAGQFSFNAHGSVAVCLDSRSMTPRSCSLNGVLVARASGVDNGAITWDSRGNGCATYTNVQTDLPLGQRSPVPQKLHLVTRLSGYDFALGTGDDSFTTYTGGSCVGATFDDTGATEIFSGTEHFVVSEHGERLDLVLTSLTNSSGSIGGFSFTGTELKQTNPESRAQRDETSAEEFSGEGE